MKKQVKVLFSLSKPTNIGRWLRRFSQKPKAYKPNLFEEDCYNLWLQTNAFQGKIGGEVFSMILPPPNITGTLHLGHAVTVCTQDTIARWKRMCNKNVLWIPGVDHAGIATQAVVEKFLMKERGISRFDMGRNKFIEEVWNWKSEKSCHIKNQLKKLGASTDWEKEFFTMDEKQMFAVTEALLTLWERNLIYRDESLVNWSPQLQSAISDIEVDYIEINGPTPLTLPGYSKPIVFGQLTDFAYKVAGSDREIVVSTTRLETIFGDVAIAVNPEDVRYKTFWGCKVEHPFTGMELPLILDSRVDPHFGTGAVKITPAHDLTDFQISKSHGLTKKTVIAENGRLENCGHLSGMKRFEAREQVYNELARLGLLRQIKPHKMNLPICSRTGDVIELLVKPQWFVKCKHMAERAIAAVENNELKIVPERYQSNWFHWLENIQDWCISRQLWWGHQLPFYLIKGEDENKTIWVAARTEEEALKKAEHHLSGPLIAQRDPDVLDTWFSSGLLPFTCFGWPKKTEEFNKYFPLQTLVTGNDILFFWVARMVMLSLELTNQLPFKEVLLHGIICDAEGRKMSKSLGNIIDPEDIINGKSLEALTQRTENSMLSRAEIQKAKTSLKALLPNGIPECGIDALRFTLLSNNIKRQFINFNINECNANRLFCNKIWQACNFVNDWIKKYSLTPEAVNQKKEPLTLMEKWILAKLNFMIKNVNEGLESQDFHLATNCIRNFIYSDLCDIYIETIKPVLKKGNNEESISSLCTLNHVLNVTIKCLSPFMPFVTEYIYQNLLPLKDKGLLIEKSYPIPKVEDIDTSLIERMCNILDILNDIRRIKHKYGVNYQHITIWLENEVQEIKDFKEPIETLAKCEIIFGSPELAEQDLNQEILGKQLAFFPCVEKNKAVERNKLLDEKRVSLQKKLNKLLEMTSKEGYKKAPLRIQKAHENQILFLKAEIEKLNTTE